MDKHTPDRDEFEKWVRRCYGKYADRCVTKDADGRYGMYQTASDWDAWQACASIKDTRIAELEAELAAEREKICSLENRNESLQDYAAYFEETTKAEREKVELLREASNEIINTAQWTYKRNGQDHFIEINGEKAYIIPFDAMNDLREAIAATEPTISKTETVED